LVGNVTAMCRRGSAAWFRPPYDTGQHVPAGERAWRMRADVCAVHFASRAAAPHRRANDDSAHQGPHHRCAPPFPFAPSNSLRCLRVINKAYLDGCTQSHQGGWGRRSQFTKLFARGLPRPDRRRRQQSRICLLHPPSLPAVPQLNSSVRSSTTRRGTLTPAFLRESYTTRCVSASVFPFEFRYLS